MATFLEVPPRPDQGDAFNRAPSTSFEAPVDGGRIRVDYFEGPGGPPGLRVAFRPDEGAPGRFPTLVEIHEAAKLAPHEAVWQLSALPSWIPVVEPADDGESVLWMLAAALREQFQRPQVVEA